MRRPRLLRRLTCGLPGLLLAGLLLLARLLAPAMAMPITAGDPLSQVPICHAGAPGEAPQPAHHGDHDCLVCPACHLVSHAVQIVPASPSLPAPRASAIGTVVSRPPATGPPGRIRTAAQPTGPPLRSA